MKRRLFFFIISLIGINSYAQEASSWIDLLGNIGQEVARQVMTDSLSQKDLVGAWGFNGTSVVLETDDILKKAAGEIAASKAESKLDEYCGKYGLTAKAGTFTFKEDGTFESITGKTTQKGTYTLSGDKLTLKYGNGKHIKNIGSLTATVKRESSGEISLLWDASRMIDVFTAITAKTSNATLQSIASLLKGYDGLKVGIRLKKK
jgi:hypothetical protein